MRTNVSVRGIIIRDGKILLIHRFKNGAEYWVVPGGGVEEGEALEEALRREMKEETGREINSFELLKTCEEAGREQNLFRCELEEGELILGGPEANDNSEENKYILTWVPIDEAKKLETVYPTILRELI